MWLEPVLWVSGLAGKEQPRVGLARQWPRQVVDVVIGGRHRRVGPRSHRVRVDVPAMANDLVWRGKPWGQFYETLFFVTNE